MSASPEIPLPAPTLSPPDAMTQPEFQKIWNLAWESYKDTTRRDVFKKKDHLRDEFEGCSSVDAITEVLKRHAKGFKDFRDGEARMRDVIKPIFRILQLVNDAGAEAAAASNHAPGGKAIFTAIGFLFQAANGVSQAYDAIEVILSKFASALGRLSTHLESSTEMSIQLREVFVQALAELIKTIGLITKYVEEEIGRTRKERTKKFLSRAAKRTVDFGLALLEKNDVKDALARLDRIVQEETITLLTETHSAVQETSRNVNVVNSNVMAIGSNISEIRTNTVSIQQDTRQTNVQVHQLVQNNIDYDIVKWLDPPDHEQNQERLQKQKQDSTCDWFFNAAFEEWRDRGTGIYWVHGNPGTGKSVLCSSVIKNLCDTISGGIVAYFYFDFRTEAKQTLLGLLSSFVFQLAIRSETCYHVLKRCRSNNRSSLRPTEAILSDCLAGMLTSTLNTFLVIDALDECPEVSRRIDVLPFIQKLVAGGDDLNLKIFVTSRPEYDIHRFFSPLSVHSISLHENSEHTRDLNEYISRTLKDAAYQRWDPHVRSLAEETLRTKANGMFLWVYLQLETLRRCPSIYVEDRLNHLPETLHDTYERILESIRASSDPATIACVRRMFECIAFAYEPLTPEELAEVFIIDFDHESGATLNPAHRSENPVEFLFSICPGFIQLSKIRRHFGESAILVVQFTHFSAREYLSSTSLPTRLQAFSLTPLSAHVTLAQMCLATLTCDEGLERHPLSVHAAQQMENYVGRYYRDQHEDVNLNKLLQRFVTPEFSFFDSYSSKEYFWWRNAPLHWASSLGFDELVGRMLKLRMYDCNYVFNGRTALCVAAELGHLDVAKALVAHGASVVLDDGYISPLRFASRRGRDEIIIFLLEHGALMAERSNTCTALHEAAQCNQLSAARILLDSDADVNALDHRGRTPLHLTMYFPSALEEDAIGETVKLITLFLECGAALEVQDHSGFTPLHLAAHSRSVDVVKTLLSHGANIHALTEASRHPLHLACSTRHYHSDEKISALPTVVLLLEYGAAINSRDSDGVTPLHLAAQQGDLNTFQALLDHGAAIDAVANNGYTPFYFAALGTSPSIARFLIEQKQSRKVQLPSGWTPLHIAARTEGPLIDKSGFQDLLNILLSTGMDIEERTKYGKTALSIAVYTQSNPLNCLLDRGANVNAADALGLEAIDYAAILTNVDNMCKLIERGADTYTMGTPIGSFWEIATTRRRAVTAEWQGWAWRRYEMERAQDLALKKRDDFYTSRILWPHQERPSTIFDLRPNFPRGERMMRRVRRFKSFDMHPDLYSLPIEPKQIYAEWKKGRGHDRLWRGNWNF